MSPENKQQIKDLTQQGESLEPVELQLLSTGSEYVIQGDSCLDGGRYAESIDFYDGAIQI